jgi:DnaJ like chaperone protein
MRRSAVVWTVGMWRNAAAFSKSDWYYDSMKWTGKVFGGVFGLMLGGPFGAALGAVAGHMFDENSGAAGTAPARDGPVLTQADVAERFFRATFEVMGHVAKADGRVSEREIDAARTVMSDFRLTRPQVDAAIAHFSRGKGQPFDLSRAIFELRRACADRPDLLRIFLEIQLRASLAGSDLAGPARQLLTRIAGMLGVSGLEFAHLEAVLRLRQGSARGGNGRADSGSAHGAQSAARLDDAYEVLEIAATVADEDVVKAYRRQLSRHHPDKLKANGLPESMLEHAKQRTQQIIEAYEAIRAARGMR